MHSLQARFIRSSITAYLRDSRKGTVLATFHRSCYLDFGDRILALVAWELGNGPLNIVLEVAPAYSFQVIPVGELVISTDELITIGTRLRISYARALPWVAAIPPWAAHPQALEANLDLCQNLLVSEAPVGSFAHALPTAPMAKRNKIEETLHQQASVAMNTLARGLSDGDLSTLAHGTRQLAGLGLGLTPSGDDVLAGVLIALTVSPPPNAGQLRATMLAATVGRNSRISAAYLDAAAKGEASEAWHRLLDVLPSADSAVVSSAARTVMAMGETSGTDMLAGFLLTLESMKRSYRGTSPRSTLPEGM
jgi:hypothetical protein